HSRTIEATERVMCPEVPTMDSSRVVVRAASRLSPLALSAALFLACNAVAASPVPAASGVQSGAPFAPAETAPIAMSPQPLPPTVVSGSGTTVSGTAGAAIAYPYPVYPGTPGLAPDHTIIVTGF